MSDAPLSASGEAAWQSLRQHIEWTPGFWIGWLFTDHTPSVHELHQRISAQLRGVNRSTYLRQPREPDELAEILVWLLSGAEGCEGCAIVAVVQSGQIWQDAWDNFVLRLNERRELLRQHLRGGLLLCAPTLFKPRSREAAPDLWSIRSLALDVAPTEHSWSNPRLLLREAARSDAVARPASVTLALQGVDAAQRAGQADAEVDARLRAAEAMFAVGRRDEGREQAVHAVQIAPTAKLRARALAILADIEDQLDDAVAAERHYLAAKKTYAHALTAHDYDNLSRLLAQRGALVEALAAAKTALVWSRAERAQLGDTSDTLRNELWCLMQVGDLCRLQAQWSAAAEAYSASLGLARRIRVLADDAPEALRAEAAVLERTGLLKHTRGQLIGAREDYESSLRLSRQIRAINDTEEALLNEINDLYRVGTILRDQDDLNGAHKALAECLRLLRQANEKGITEPEHLHNEGVSLAELGQIKHRMGDAEGAKSAYEASIAVYGQARLAAGDSPETLRAEASALANLGSLLEASAEQEALKAYSNSLEGSRRFRSKVGDTTDALRLIASILHRYGRLNLQIHQLDVARESLMEALELERQLYMRDRSPSNARALARALEGLGDVLREEAAALRAAADE